MSAADQPPLRQFPDRSIRQTLQHPANLRVLVEQVVPHLADRFDFARRKLVDRLFPLEDWREREADLPFEVPFRVGDEERWALVVILLEHQSDTDRFMPLRLLLFIVLYWDRQWREWLESPQPREPWRLRPILPIVFYTGPTNWGSARAIVDLLDEPAEFHSFVPSWEPLFWNLAERSPDELLAATGEFLKALAVIRAADADAEAFAKVFEQAVQGIAGLVAKDSVQWHDLMRLLLTWAYWRRPADERENLEKVAVSSQREESVQKEVKSMSYNQGEKEGREEGRKEGALAAARFTLIAVIERKYKAVPEPLSLEIEACVDLGRLQAATSLAATAERVEEIML